MNRLVVINALSPYQLQITETENGAEAIQILKQQQFDIILMDIQMPVMGGKEATSIIRNKLNLDTPIIALTANAFKSDIDSYLSIGINDYVTKPFEEEHLIQVINKNIISSKTPMDIGGQHSSSEETTGLYDLSQLRKMSRGNESFILKMLRLFTDIAPKAVLQINNALEQEDLDTIRRVAHKLKPSVDNLMINSIRNEIRELELSTQINIKDERLSFLVHKVSDTLNNVVQSIQEDYFEK